MKGRLFALICMLLTPLMALSVYFTVSHFNTIKHQYNQLDPNLDNYSTGEVLFLSFERMRTAVYETDTSGAFPLKKEIFDAKVNVLNFKAIDSHSFYYNKHFAEDVKVLEAQSKKLGEIYTSMSPGKERQNALLHQIDVMTPTMEDIQEVIYSIQLNNFQGMKSLIKDNAGLAEISALCSLFLFFLFVATACYYVITLRDVIKKKNIFISTIYHELSGSLHKIQMTADLINPRDDVLSTQKYLSRIMFHTNKLTQQTKEIMEYSKIEIGNVTLKNSSFSLEELLEAGISLFNEQHGNRLVTRICPHEGYIYSDMGKLTSVISNFLDNANKNTDHGVISVYLKINRDRLVIRVRDNGSGFDINKLPFLFKPFNQGIKSETRQGIGLGLSIVNNYVRLLKGKIRVRSVPGEGSTFTVFIPLSSFH
ncbi:Sensor histidine kinase RcsC [Pantoea ananatis]|uniref:sensor histidine kinase n=1 Tax=Pantoea ananas TaxID=553 RepID=UPI0021F6E6ED|nr:HAMP domain-containing sensor histidine kinase [Pantoea ananatis]MCW0314502.1 Sensor histidine kinase RcsC [Pantoea ananatis]